MRYVISDIHGCSRTFRTLVEDVLKFSDTDELYLLGDYVDRGPDSKGVLDFIMELQQGDNVRVVRGNHDHLMMESAGNRATAASWTINGGESTLRSFGIEDPTGIPPKYLDLVRKMEYFIELDDVFLVHAGFNFSAEDVFADLNSMMYIRHMKIDNALVKYKKIIHGHTPILLSTIRESVDKAYQEVNIDNGCVFGPVEGYGNLVALELDEMRLHIQPYIG